MRLPWTLAICALVCCCKEAVTLLWGSPMRSSGAAAQEFVAASSNWIRYPDFYAHCFSHLYVPRRSSSQTLPVLRHRPGADRWQNPMGLMNFPFGMRMIAIGLVHPQEILGSVGLRCILEEMRIWLLLFSLKSNLCPVISKMSFFSSSLLIYMFLRWVQEVFFSLARR